MYKSLAFLIILSGVSNSYSTDYVGLPQGPFCSRQNIGCCPDRHDECAAEILGTLCYCDHFCNSTRNTDCCPDYWSHCLHIEHPPEPVSSCYHNGQYIGYGRTSKVNCNECTCTGNQVTCSQNECVIDPSLTDHINERHNNYLWMATNYSEFWGINLNDALKFKLGTHPPNRMVLQMNSIRESYDKQIPSSFDANQNWRDLMTPIQDQKWCGSSWAVSTVAVSNDRFVIFNKGREHVKLSAQDLISCTPKGQQGCSGGHVERAWKRIMKYGIVSENCFPYQGTNERCQLPKGYRKGIFYCPNGNHDNKVYHVGPAYRISNETDIMAEILRNGPVQSIMKVYRDFFSYREGIYQHSRYDSSREFGYHAVRILGWGEDSYNGRLVKYWKVANSWGTRWGENGYFRILKGVNECDIENLVLAAWPLIDGIGDSRYTGYNNNKFKYD